MTKEKSKTGKGILYLLFGGGIGAVLALLFAPKTGKEMRGEIGGAAQKGWDKTGEFAANIGDQAQSVYQGAKNKTGEFYDAAKQKLDSATASITAVTDYLHDAPEGKDTGILANIEAAKNEDDRDNDSSFTSKEAKAGQSF